MTLRFLILPLLFLALVSGAQNAPVTTLGVVTNAVPNGAVVVPVTVSDFMSIGSFTLSMRYRIAKATYISATPNPALTNISVVHSISGNFGYLVINWPQTPGGVTLPDEAHLLDLNFTYLTGSTSLTWLYTDGYVCEYKKYSGGNYILLNDSPESSYFINGGISNRTAPVTTAAIIANAIPGNQYDVPVTATGFTSIGSMYLRMEYDSTALTFQSLTKNPAFSGSFSYSIANVTGTTKRIIVGWYGSGLTFADSATIFTVRFTYNNNAGNSNYSALYWYDDGPSCQYADANANTLIDIPYDNYLISGLVFSQYAAKTWLPAITDATPNSAVAIPVKTKDFTNISSFNLTIEYDTSAMSYSGFTANDAFGGALTVTNTTAAGSKRRLVISWPGTGPLTLPDSATLVTLNLTSKDGSTELAWVTNDANSCRFNDNLGNAYYDRPKNTFYRNGLLATKLAPLSITGQASPPEGQQVTIPVLVYRFLDIGIWDLVLDYDPGVLTYQGAALVPAIGGAFSATTAGAGRIIMNWSGTAASLADNSTLVNLTFTYNGGESVLAWYDNSNSCKYAASASDSALYDKPASQYYINGYTGPTPVSADFIAGNLLPAVYQAITFTDQSTGNPSSWNWIISPSAYYFANGTSAGSQNPQVVFTQGGAYTVTLIASRGMLSSAEVKTNYIHAGTSGMWTGNTSANWYTSTNWHNHLVPNGTVSVTIPGLPAGSRFPVVPGNLVTTINCMDITLESPAILTIGGEFTVNPGTQVTTTGTGNVIIQFE